jgi:hypothetical protein
MDLPNLPTWQKHTRAARTRGLSAACLACLGTQPTAHADPASFTGFIGTVICLNRADAVAAGTLAAQAIGSNRGIHAVRVLGQYKLHVPISKQAARELAQPKHKPTDPSPGHGARSAGYNAAMRPTARARSKAREILRECVP